MIEGKIIGAVLVLSIMIGGGIVSARTHNIAPTFAAVLVATIVSIVAGLLR